MQLNRLEVEALLRIRNSPEFASYRELLKRRSDQARNSCTALSGESLLRAQGRAQELQEQQNLIEEAPSLFEKVKDQKR